MLRMRQEKLYAAQPGGAVGLYRVSDFKNVLTAKIPTRQVAAVTSFVGPGYSCDDTVTFLSC